MKRLLFLSLLIASAARAQHVKNTLSEFGYKGPIREITTQHYRNLDQRDGQWILERKDLWSARTSTYNLEGMITGYVVRQWYSGKSEETHATYTLVNGTPTGVTLMDTTGKVLSTGTTEWLNNTSYIERSYHPDGSRIAKQTTFLDRQYRIVKDIHLIYNNDDSLYYSTETGYAYNSGGELKSYTETDLREHTSTLVHCRILEKDLYGNPLVMIGYEDDPSDVTMIVKEFRYFDDRPGKPAPELKSVRRVERHPDFDTPEYQNGTLTEHTYTNRRYGFSLSFPDGWSAMNKRALDGPDRTISEHTLVLLTKTTTDSLFRPVITVVTEDVADRFDNAWSFTSFLKDQIVKSYPDATDIEDGDSRKLGDAYFAKLQVHLQRLNAADAIIGVTQTYYTAIVDGHALTILATYSTPEEAEEVEAILKTVKLED